MKMLARNAKAAVAGAALAVLLSAGLLHGCAYDADYVQINGGATATPTAGVMLTVHAKNGNGVYAYFLSEVNAAESPSTPAPGATGWQSIANASTAYDADLAFTLTSPSTQRAVYVWFKDAYGTVSDPVSDTIWHGATGGGGPTPGY